MVDRKGSEGGGVVWCHDEGTNCVTPTYTDADGERTTFFAKESAQSSYRDAALEQLADQMNELVSTTRSREIDRKDAGRQITIGFLVTGSGFLPVWKRDVGEGETLADLVDVSTLTDLDAMDHDRLASHLRLQTEADYAGTWYDYTKSGGTYNCKGESGSCFVTAASRQGLTRSMRSNYFTATEEGSPLHDKALNALSDQLNDLLTEVQSRERQQRGLPDEQEIGLLRTGAGLLPIWKTVTHATN